MRATRTVLIAVWLACVGFVQAASNLVANGSFEQADDEGKPVDWKYKYDLEGESWYFDNHKYVSIKDSEGRKNALCLWGDVKLLQVPGQGVQVDGKPIPVTDLPKSKFKFSAFTRSSGPWCRILIEGYRWRPGIKPHSDPQLHELRKCYKFSQLYFGSQTAGTCAQPLPKWTRGETEFPDPQLAKSPLAQDILSKIRFLVVHIIAINGSEGELFVDDVKVEKIK